MFLALALLLADGALAATMGRRSLEDAAGNSTVCPYTYSTTFLRNRRPQVLPIVECHNKEHPQQVTYIDDRGQYNRTCVCTEIFTTINVTYQGQGKTEEIPIVIGCACVNEQAKPSSMEDANIVY